LFAVTLGTDGAYVPTNQHIVGVMVAILIFQGFINSLNTKLLGQITTFYVIFHTAVIISGCVALLALAPKNSAEYAFTHFETASGWNPVGFSAVFGTLSVSWVLTDYDGISHITEEMANPEMTAPLALTGAMGYTYFIGIVLNIVLVFCMGDPASFISSSQPVMQIFYNVLGKGGGIFFTIAGFLILNFVGITATHACSRTMWAFARDEMIPFSRFWYKISKTTTTPLNCVWFTVVACILINLIGLGSSTTINAIFNVCAIALDWSYCIPIACKILFNLFEPGPFYLGHRGSLIINSYAVVWTAFISIIFLMPTSLPVTPASMNYAVVILAGIGLFSAVYWFISGHRFYIGPRANIRIVDGISDLGQDEIRQIEEPADIEVEKTDY
jgi:amino acid transporter